MKKWFMLIVCLTLPFAISSMVVRPANYINKERSV